MTYYKKTAIETIGVFGIIALLLWAPFAQSSDSYTARVNEKGEFCAKVKVQDVSGFYKKRIKCRTLNEWEAAGYDITIPPVIEEEFYTTVKKS